VRREALKALKQNIQKIDKTSINEHVFACLDKVRKMGNPPDITMIVL
jgi:hypothetical protein